MNTEVLLKYNFNKLFDLGKCEWFSGEYDWAIYRGKNVYSLWQCCHWTRSSDSLIWDASCRLLMIIFNVFYVFVFVFISKIYLKEMNKKCYLLSMQFPLLLLMTCLCEVPASFLFFRHCQDGSRTTSTIMGNKNKQWLQTLWILSYTFPKKVSICLIYLISVQTIIWNYPCFFFSWPRDKKLNT